MFRPLRRLYDWVLGWNRSPYGAAALFLLAVAEASFFPIPPDVLLIALALGRPRRAFSYALLCTAGSVLGGIGGYGIGLGLMKGLGCPIVSFYDGAAVFDRIAGLFNAYSFWAVFAAALTPIPYKIFTIAAGSVHSSFDLFLFASVTGRALRFFAVTALIYFFGNRIRNFVDRSFNSLTVIFFLLLIGGFFTLQYASDGSRGSGPLLTQKSFFSEICAGFR